MAEEDDDEQQEMAAAAPAPPSKPPSLLRYLPLVLIILLLQAGAAYFVVDQYMFTGDDSDLISVEEGERPRVIPESNEPEASVDLGEIIVNPRSDDARLLLTTEVTLAVAPDDAKGEIERDEVIDRVLDAVNYELSYATPEELNNRDGRDVVKQRLMKRVNELIYEGQVVDVFFEKFILQAMAGYKGE